MAVAAPASPPASAAEGSAWRGGRPLLWSLLGLVLYACFADGAIDLPQESWLQLAILVMAVVAGGAALYAGARPAAPALAWVGVGLLGAFAVWTGLTMLWSVAPDRSWMSFNRALAYVLLLALAITAGSTVPRAADRLAKGIALVSVPVALYALGGKTLPGVSFWFVDLDHAGGVTRLRAPLEYWNALALVCVFGLLPMLRMAADPARGVLGRLSALGGVYLLATVIGMTYSRGGVLAFVVGIAVLVALTSERVRTLALLGVALTGAVVPLTLALASPDLTTNTLPLERREDDALRVLIAFLVSGALVAAFGRLVLAFERRPAFAPERGRRVGRVAAIALAALLALGTLNAAATGALGDAADRFTDTNTDPTSDPTRLLSTNSGNRWTWWKEAAGAWSDEPVAGWGAGSFPVTHKRYRTVALPVQHPHSVALQFLAETGLVGLLLAFGGLAVLTAAAVLAVRRLPWRVSGAPPGRGYGAALAAIPVAWIVHSFYDWDWDIPAVTMPMLLALGVLVARPARPQAIPLVQGGILRALGYAAAVAALLFAALSALLPAIAETQTNSALAAVGAEKVSEERLAEAAADAELAADLNPLAVEPLFAAASIAERRGRLDEARRLLLRALERQPESVDAWFRLARIEFTRLDRAGVRRAAQRALELDPLNGAAFALARRAQQAAVAPGESATATGSPLPTQVPVTEPVPVPGATAPQGVPAPSPSPSPTATPPPTGATGGVSPDQGRPLPER